MRLAYLFIFLLISLFKLDFAFAYDIGLNVSANDNWYNWGDYILGQDLKNGFKNLGHNVYTSYINNQQNNSTTTQIDIYMHGFVPFNPEHQDNKINVLYLYYPLETLNMEKYKNILNVEEPDWYSLQTELWNFDLIAVASPRYQKEIEKFGIKTIFTPQFTDPEKFFYEYDADKSYDILFVGRPGYERISALWAIENGFDVALFGEGWQNKVPQKYFKGDYIDNKELHKYYASAKIVLNDTREDMKKNGFISNRVFDVTASGGFLISDYMPEIEKFYGDAIPMFRTKEELKELLTYYLNNPEERLKKAKQAQKITLENFTNTLVAKKIITSIEEPFNNNQLIIKSPWSQNEMQIGDYWLGLDMQYGLQQNGFDVQNYYNDNGFTTDEFYKSAKNLLYLQFKNNFTDFEDENKARIMYLYFPTFVPDRGKFINQKDNLIYNTDAYLNNELELFDLIATPAKEIFHTLQDKGYSTAFVSQFTNPEKFYSAPDAKLATDLLFVGSTWYDRISALYAVELGYNINIYGSNWKGKVPDKYIKGSFIDNRELHKYYSSAKIVLSDQAQDLSEMGLVINRLFDATACGAFVISAYSPYIEEIFGDSIPLFKNKEEFKKLVDYYLAHPQQRRLKAQQAQQITLKHYTAQAVGLQLKHLFSKIHEAKK